MTSREDQRPTAAEWRATMGCFPTGVTIVTSWRGAIPVGATISAISSVSLNPPMLLTCVDFYNPLYEAIVAAGVFGVNFLAEDQVELAMRFARAPEEERFTGHAYRAAAAGAPRLELAPTFVDCEVESTLPAGDHLIVVGRAMRVEREPQVTPLLYHRGGFPRMLAATICQ